MIITTVITVIVISAVAVIILDGQRGWNIMYNHIYSNVVTDSYVARKKFNTVMRRASGERPLLDDGKQNNTIVSSAVSHN